MPCGIARLAIVIPETKSDLKRLKVYEGAQLSMGRMYCRNSINFLEVLWPLNCLSGSSGKKVSFMFERKV